MGRSKSIDVLRALAVMLVLGAHLFPCPREVSPALHVLTSGWSKAGWVGVDLFFVLSGFLVSGLLYREHQRFGRVSAADFLIRRGLKIYPAFWLMTIVSVAVLALGSGPPHVHSVLTELLFLQNYLSPIWNHTWSLAVEEHFYLLLLLLIVVITRSRPGGNPFSAIPSVFLVVAAGCLLLRVTTCQEVPYENVAPRTLAKHLFPTHLRMDALLFGVCLSYFYHYHNRRFMEFAGRYRSVLACLGTPLLLIGLAFSVGSPAVFTWGYSATYFGSGCILVSSLTWGRESKSLNAAAYVGSHSYSVYLWHMPLFSVVSGWFFPSEAAHGTHGNWWMYAACSLAGAIALGILAAVVVEFPVLKLRDRWFPSRSNALESPANPGATNRAALSTGEGQPLAL